jgi:hypothetical protein
MTDKAKKYKEKRAAEKAKKEAKNRAKLMTYNETKEVKAIAAQVRLDFYLFSFKYTAKIRTFVPQLYMSSKYN